MPHRTGKTTIVERLSESLPEYSCEEEAYYELEEKGYVFAETPSLEDYIAQLEHSIYQVTTSGDNVIFDRCPIDMLAYIQATNEFEDIDMQSLYQRVQRVMTEIDLLVFVAIEGPDIITCLESELPELRQEVNEILNEWVWDFDIDVIEVSGSSLARTKQVIEHIAKI